MRLFAHKARDLLGLVFSVFPTNANNRTIHPISSTMTAATKRRSPAVTVAVFDPLVPMPLKEVQEHSRPRVTPGAISTTSAALSSSDPGRVRAPSGPSAAHSLAIGVAGARWRISKASSAR